MLLPLLIAASIALADAPATGHLPPRPVLPVVPVPLIPGPVLPLRPHPERPDDGLLGKGVFVVKHELPPEVRSLIQHLDEDRDNIAGYVSWALWLATAGVILAALAVVRYVCSGWGRGRAAADDA